VTWFAPFGSRAGAEAGRLLPDKTTRDRKKGSAVHRGFPPLPRSRLRRCDGIVSKPGSRKSQTHVRFGSRVDGAMARAFFTFCSIGRVRSRVQPFDAAGVAAAPNALRGSGLPPFWKRDRPQARHFKAAVRTFKSPQIEARLKNHRYWSLSCLGPKCISRHRISGEFHLIAARLDELVGMAGLEPAARGMVPP